MAVVSTNLDNWVGDVLNIRTCPRVLYTFGRFGYCPPDTSPRPAGLAPRRQQTSGHPASPGPVDAQ